MTDIITTGLMKEKLIEDYTLEEFRMLQPFYHEEDFNGIVFVPMADLHDSGYRCMRFILEMNHRMVGVIGGWQDVVHVNGTLGVGYDFEEALRTGMTRRVGWMIDCLPESGCIRMWQNEYILKVGDDISSSFSFYVAGERDKQ